MYIEPKILKGFRDVLPAQEIERKHLTEQIETVFRGFGFVPIDTPALEYAEVLLGKGGGETEKQVYRFADAGNRDIALRFDLTVPLARYVAQHRAELSFPFKRYHIAKVWRGENTQRGRYREFTQCDIDTIGIDSAAADFEILLLMRGALAAVTPSQVNIKINHRGLFNRFLVRLQVEDKSVDILRTVDKLAKIGEAETLKLLSDIAGTENAQKIVSYISINGDWDEMLQKMTEAAGGSCPASERLATIHHFMTDAGVAANYTLDPSITRGLDYYTGIVYETFLNDLPAIGSVCSGGRYDNLAGMYTKPGAASLCGVGSSIGLDRLLAGLEALGQSPASSTYARAAVACVDEGDMGAYQALAHTLRERGIACEVFLEPKKLSAQFMAADKQGIGWMVIPDADVNDTYALRNLKTRDTEERLRVEEIARKILA
jgi:histidyl-tRNA synthetase